LQVRVEEGTPEQREDVVVAARTTGVLVSLCVLLFLYIAIFRGDIQK
jgi:hypothetical protein